MNKEQQNLSWSCLPKEVREEIKKEYQRCNCGSYIEDLLEDLFGHHNLTSDTEPEEMLMVERKKVVEEHKCHMGSNEYGLGYTDALEDLFGDKCLPDNELEHRLEQASVQVEPKYDIGQQVKIILCTHPEYRNKVGIITSIDSCGNPYVKVEGLGTLFHAPYALEPYTEPETKDNMEKNSMEISKLF